MVGAGSSAAVEGRIDPERPIQTHLARALLPLVRGRRTGALQIVEAGEPPLRAQLVVADGAIVFAEAEADVGKLLERLVDAGALVPVQAMRIARRVNEDRGWSGVVRASELAVFEGHVRPEVAMTAASEVVRARVESCLRITAGAWSYRDDPRAAAVPRYPVTFEKAVLDATAAPDQAPRFHRALARYADRYPKLEGQRNERTTSFGLTPARFRTLRLLDGMHRLSDVLAQSPLGAVEAAALLAGLTMLERIWWNAEPTARASVPLPTVRPERPTERPLTIERAPPELEQLRALGRMPTPAPAPGSSPQAALISELLRRGAPRAVSEIRPPTQPASSPDHLSARGHLDRGVGHMLAGRLPAAAADFHRAIQLEPTNLGYQLHARFVAWLQAPAGPLRARAEKELHELATQLSREGQDAFAHHALGRIHYDAGDDDRALRAFRAAERLAPGDVENQRYLRLLTARIKK
jgi:tetratricopeptide (TPR) repeat protein